MIIEIYGANVPQAYTEALWKMRTYGEKENSRGGEVIAIPHPVVLTIERPWERVLTDPVRDANPFFHCMEFVWMMAGSNDAVWLSQFNKRMIEYADNKILRGAYGWRWTNPSPQISDTIRLLQTSPETRQAVLTMWDPVFDGYRARTSDRPCNTHIYFRKDKDNRLNMTVCNRSNDLIWGMMGANAVHMTMLHELISRAVGMKQGTYHVFTNNLHIYTGMPKFEELYTSTECYDTYEAFQSFPLLQYGEDWENFIIDCKTLLRLVRAGGYKFLTTWMNNVGAPIHDAYVDKKNRHYYIEKIAADDWRIACEEWAARRNN